MTLIRSGVASAMRWPNARVGRPRQVACTLVPLQRSNQSIYPGATWSVTRSICGRYGNLQSEQAERARVAWIVTTEDVGIDAFFDSHAIGQDLHGYDCQQWREDLRYVRKPKYRCLL